MSKMSKAVAVLGIVAGLGVAALPLSSYAVAGQPGDSKTITAEAQVGDSIELTTSATTVTMANVVANAAVNEASTTLNIKTNSTNGYNVMIKDADATTDLTSTTTSSVIPAGSPAAKTNAWGVKASSAADGVSIVSAYQDYRGVLASTDSGNGKFAARDGAGGKSKLTPAAGDDITLTFGVTIDMSIPAGSYKDDVIVTATTL